MYEQFYRLSAEPFRLSPDHRFCFNHEHYAKAKAYVAYAYMRAEGFVMVTGNPGTGKTTLVGDLVETLSDDRVEIAELVSTQLEADDLLRMVAYAFDVDATDQSKSATLRELSQRFMTIHARGGRAVLIVDEAQDLTVRALEELRLLTNIQTDGQPLVQVFLLGQSELRETVHQPGLEQVQQRIVAASHLEALQEDETRAYVEHRLSMAGWRGDPAISDAVYPAIYQFSEGIPRRINLICSRLFLRSAVEHRHQILLADARAVIEELQDEQLSTRNLLGHDLFHAQDAFSGASELQVAPRPATIEEAAAEHEELELEVEPAEPVEVELEVDVIVEAEPDTGASIEVLPAVAEETIEIEVEPGSEQSDDDAQASNEAFLEDNATGTGGKLAVAPGRRSARGTRRGKRGGARRRSKRQAQAAANDLNNDDRDKGADGFVAEIKEPIFTLLAEPKEEPQAEVNGEPDGLPLAETTSRRHATKPAAEPAPVMSDSPAVGPTQNQPGDQCEQSGKLSQLREVEVGEEHQRRWVFPALVFAALAAWAMHAAGVM